MHFSNININIIQLIGTDYGNKIEGIGPANAYKLIKEHKNIESIIDFIKN